MAHTVNKSSPARHTIATGGEYRSKPAPSLQAFKEPLLHNQYAEHMSPAEAAFAYDEHAGNVPARRQTSRTSLNRRDMPVDSGYNSDKGSFRGLPSPVEEKTLAQLYEDKFHRKDRLMPTLKERMKNESPVIAHLRTNVIVNCGAFPLRSTCH